MFLRLLLFPLAVLYDCATRLRNRLFDCNVLLHRRTFPLPIVCVGNLSVGGTGKTPHVEYLLRLLAPGRHVAVLSRGYGRKTKGFRLAGKGETAATIGDEPFQMHRKFPDVAIAADEKRCRGIDCLMSGARKPDAVILDDAFQHRYVQAGLYILLTDYSRLYTDDFLLPAGRLREARSGARRAHIIIVTKCPPRLTPAETENIKQRLRPTSDQRIFFTALRYADVRPLFPGTANPDFATATSALLITGIACPEPLRRHLGQMCADVRALPFPDHHTYTPADVRQMNATFGRLPSGAVAVTTEKDAVRLLPLADSLSPQLRAALYVQPIEIYFLDDTNKVFNKIITDYVTENKRNSTMD